MQFFDCRVIPSPDLPLLQKYDFPENILSQAVGKHNSAYARQPIFHKLGIHIMGKNILSHIIQSFPNIPQGFPKDPANVPQILGSKLQNHANPWQGLAKKYTLFATLFGRNLHGTTAGHSFLKLGSI